MAIDRMRGIMDTLGMARRAGLLIVGQDHVFSAMRSVESLLVLVTDDCSAAVLRSLAPKAERGEARVLTLKGVDRAELGSRLGVGTAQIAALPMGGFTKKVLSLYDRSDADE